MAKKKKQRKIRKPNPPKADLRTPKYKKRVVPSVNTKVPPEAREWD